MALSFPYHPAYGLDDSTRLTVLRSAETLGAAQAAALHNVSVASVYKWRAALKQEGSKT